MNNQLCCVAGCNNIATHKYVDNMPICYECMIKKWKNDISKLSYLRN